MKNYLKKVKQTASACDKFHHLWLHTLPIVSCPYNTWDVIIALFAIIQEHHIGSRGGILLIMVVFSTLIMHYICIIESTIAAKELLRCQCNYTDIVLSQHCSKARSLLCKIQSKCNWKFISFISKGCLT